MKLVNLTNVREIGKGGGATVFSAHDATLGRDVAVKRVDAKNAPLLAQAQCEEERLFRLRHPFLVRCYCSFYDGDYFYIVLDVAETDVRNYFDRLPAGVARRKKALIVAWKLIFAIEYLHANAIAHRDIKPSNVLFNSESNDVILCDLGSAKTIDDEDVTIVGACFRKAERFF
jgi:serine/threonine protein kinase